MHRSEEEPVLISLEQNFGVDLEARARVDRKRVPILVTTLLTYLDNRMFLLDFELALLLVLIYFQAILNLRVTRPAGRSGYTTLHWFKRMSSATS